MLEQTHDFIIKENSYGSEESKRDRWIEVNKLNSL